MELRRYLAVLRNRLVFILVTVAVALAAAYAVTPRQTIYTAKSTLFIGSKQVDRAVGSDELSNDFLTALDRIALTYAVMIDTAPIAGRALQITGAQRSAAAVVGATQTEPEPATQLLYIRVSDPDPAVAQTLANGLADGFLGAVDDLEAPGLPVSIFERATLPTVPKPSPLLRNLLQAGLFGLISAIGVVFLLDYLDLTIRDADDVERRLELPVLGVVPTFGQELPLEPVPSLRARRQKQGTQVNG